MILERERGTGVYLVVLAVSKILLSVQKPVWNFVWAGCLKDRYHSFDLRTSEQAI